MSIAQRIADICIKTLKSGKTIYFIGNGGSAADAQHLAAELVGKLNFKRPPLAAIALTTDTSILTAIGNDYGFEYVFSRQIEALGKPLDILIALSTSGKSPNVLNAMKAANNLLMNVIGMTGENIEMEYCYLLYQAPSSNTQEIQEHHIKIGHEFCGIIEREMFGEVYDKK